MKKTWIIVISIGVAFLCVLLFYSYQNIKVDKPIEDKDKPILKIAGDSNFPPYEFIDDKGKYKGFNIDVMESIGEAMDIEIQLIPMRWSDAVIALENQRVDVFQGMSKIPSREGKYLFTQSTIVNSSAIFIRKDTEHIKGIEDLKGARVAYQVGDINEDKIRNIPFAIMVPRYNQREKGI